jgi:site-specific recombinase XerD
MILYREAGWSIFTIPTSAKLQVRATVQGKTRIKSTDATELETAKTFGRRFFRDLHPIGFRPPAITFEDAAQDVIRHDEGKIRRGERNRELNDGQTLPLVNHLAPFFGGMPISEISYGTLSRLIDHLSDKGLKTASIRRYMVFVSKTLRFAHRRGVIERLPEFPTIKGKVRSRAWFSPDEYRHLLRTIRQMETEETKIRTQRIGFELRALVIFLATTFLRPGDFKQLRHRNIEIVTRGARYLRILTSTSKTVMSPVVSMPAAVQIYSVVLRRQRAIGYGKPDDFVFMPQYQNRQFAYEMFRHQFRAALMRAQLERSPTGDPRSLYSLRHTAIMERLTRGDQIDLLTLARNCRTSVEMIDRFYARHLTAEMNVAKIQSTIRHARSS